MQRAQVCPGKTRGDAHHAQRLIPELEMEFWRREELVVAVDRMELVHPQDRLLLL